MAKILVSACLLGYETRYDGKSMACQKVMDLAKDNVLIPVCPEQLGGLQTPRNPAERQDDKSLILMNDGTDVSGQYRKGADIAVSIAQMDDVDYCILKANSPSCGCGRIYDGTFSGNKVPGDGVTAEALKKAGFRVITEEDL